MRTYGLSEPERRAVISAARLLLIRLSHEQSDYEPQIQGFDCHLAERVALIEMTPVIEYKPLQFTDIENDHEENAAFERQVEKDSQSYICWQ